MSLYDDLQKNLVCALDLNRNPVGIKFLYSESEFDECEVPRVKYKLSYCSMVQLATKGKCLKANFENSGCCGATRALGLEELDEQCHIGNRYYYLNMYNSMCVAKKTHKEANIVSQRIYGVVAQPLSEFKEEPDVVIVVTIPYNMMRIIQGYSYHNGLCNNIRFDGNQALCLECTTRPYETNDINVSVLCSNTRFLAKWDKTEMAIGIPYNRFPMLVDGVMKTINATEKDEGKREIIARAEKEGLDFSHITYGSSYY
ncbi:Uncharacterized conserved protein, DUF169 family [Hathewaya proteolytica DSM 3090]|uniref:Uncharacterized conserved protein, DUF169 family n=1 Tax=Hathewaya proteolytica DSM 3090 TaxID=1121331 RepID=A0A1M6KK85_9CLOT|nr:DUF169 domain-containing protein [Hathewaya proteolytica]SHJ59363.1 Uncharacterized conserved protein, DUF169 family [Hathewaya proteolytica DSM 3090]